MKIATARKKTSKNWRTQDITWEQFLKRIETPLRTGETVREYKAMSKEDRDIAKEAAGGFVAGALSCGQRKTENVTERSMITLDADNANVDAWENVTCLYDDFAMACYSTHSHTNTKPRLRWIIPTSRPMTPEEYPAIARKVATWLDIDTMDATTYEVARLMYFPTCSSDGDYTYRVQNGPMLDPDEVLRSYGENDAWKDSSLWPMAKDELVLRQTAMKKAGEPTEKNGMVGLFCRTYDVPTAIDEFLPDVYTPCEGYNGGEARYTYAAGSTAGGAIVYNDGAFLYSNHATDPCGGRSVNAFDLVRIHKFGHLDSDDDLDVPVTKQPSYAAMCEFASGLDAVKEQMVQERTAEMEEEFGDLFADVGNKAAAETAVEEADDPASGSTDKPDTSWMKKLDLNKKTGECEPSIENAMLIMLNDPMLKDRYGYDLFAERPKLKGDVPWRDRGEVKKSKTGHFQNWEDHDDSGLRWYMQSKWKFRSNKDLDDARMLAMRKNKFHPVREYLDGLKWDGVKRLDTLFIDYLGAEDNIYTRAAARKWMAGAVARIRHPGCKFDEAVVLVGLQGKGKSTFADILSKGWFNDSLIEMGNKDGYECLHGFWIIELAELSSVKRSDVETVKTFISKKEDTYRAAYGRNTMTVPRQCVFFGTTNEQEFLRDRSGSRRWWPIIVEKDVDFDRLRGNIDQIWAEASVAEASGEKLWLDKPELREEWEKVVARHQVQDEFESQIIGYLDMPLPDNWETMDKFARRDYIQGDSVFSENQCTRSRDVVCISEIRFELCGEDRKGSSGYDLLSRRIANVMNNLPGWQKSKSKRRRVQGEGPVFQYYRTGSHLYEQEFEW